MGRYKAGYCDNDGCYELPGSNSMEKAYAKLVKAVERASKRTLGGRTPEGRVYGEVKDAEGNVVRIAERHYGEPPKHRAPRRQRPPTAHPPEEGHDDGTS